MAALSGHGVNAPVGALVGDFAGSRFERHNYTGTEFDLVHADCRFTDDSWLTLAAMEALMAGGRASDFAEHYRAWYRRTGNGYGPGFRVWAENPEREPFSSPGCGPAMRVSPVGWWCATLEETLEVAHTSAAVTHSKAIAIEGAQAVAGGVFLARTGHSKDEIADFWRARWEGRTDLSLRPSVDAVRATHPRGADTPEVVPPACSVFLHSGSLEEAVRNAVSVGGDSDTIASIASALAEAFHGHSDLAELDAILARLRAEGLAVLERFGAACPGWPGGGRAGSPPEPPGGA